VGLFPAGRVCWSPNGLRAGAVEHDLCKAFEFSTVAAIEKGVFVHKWSGLKALIGACRNNPRGFGHNASRLAVMAQGSRVANMESILVLTISGRDRAGLVENLAAVVAEH